MNAATTGDLGDFKPQELALQFASITLSGILFHRWAALEYRIVHSIRLEPKAWGSFFWYPANNRFGFLAQIVLVLGFIRLLSLFFFFLPDIILATSVPVSPLQIGFASIIRSAFVPLGYFWSQTEYNFAKTPWVRRTWTNFFRTVSKTRAGEQAVGLLALIVLTIWNIILLVDCKAIPLVASFPDSDGIPIGLGPVLSNYVVSILMVGWLPWIAVWRGMPKLFVTTEDQGQLNLFL
ncbi:MAG TPA: hypothetical protein VGP65_15510 [Candidatus Angelobacter sp.]|nr:hypothetical protein [Candidatus Angelobacter sp.]